MLIFGGISVKVGVKILSIIFPFFFNEVKKTSFFKTYKKYYFNNDPHFNKEGHKALADKLIEIFN